MNQSDLLHIVKTAISQGRFDAAIKPLEQILTLLKFDFDSGIDREKNGKAYNALLKVRKECIAGVLSSESYRILRLSQPRKEEPKVEPAPEARPEPKPAPKPEPKVEKKEEISPEEAALAGGSNEYQFHWDEIPTVTFEDIAGLDECKALVERKVLLPLLHPEMLEGYVNGGGGGVCLYGPPGTGKTMISAAIAN